MATRKPRCYVTIGGGPRIPCIGARINRTSKRKSDTFSADLAITKTKEYGYGLPEWCEMQKVDVSVIFSTTPGGDDEQVMMSGQVDVPQVDPFQMTVTLSGRDKSASLTQKKRNEKFQNQKPKDIAEKIAKDHGLKLKISGDAEFSGKLFNKDTVLLALNRPDFSIMSDLAAGFGCRWYVDGDDLIFEPTEQDSDVLDLFFYPPGVIEAYAVSNLTRLKLSRNMTAAKPHSVTVASWHREQGKLYKHTEKLSGQGDPIEYRHHHNGRTQAQVEALAKARLKNHTRHELGIAAGMPGRLDVDVNQKMRLRGTGSIFDQTYDIDTLGLVMRWEDKFDMDLTGRGAKEGRSSGDGAGSSSGTGTGASGAPATQGPPAPITSPPQPPQRPAGL